MREPRSGTLKSYILGNDLNFQPHVKIQFNQQLLPQKDRVVEGGGRGRGGGGEGGRRVGVGEDTRGESHPAEAAGCFCGLLRREGCGSWGQPGEGSWRELGFLRLLVALRHIAR